MNPTDQLAAEAAGALYDSRNSVTRECFRLSFKSACEKAYHEGFVNGARKTWDEVERKESRAAHASGLPSWEDHDVEQSFAKVKSAHASEDLAQAGVQPRITSDGHCYMLVSEHYAKLNELLQSRDCGNDTKRLDWFMAYIAERDGYNWTRGQIDADMRNARHGESQTKEGK